EETFYLATRWSDPERDVRVARELAIDLLKRDKLFCVWTGKKLKEDSLDIDHCFPWSSWPCGDLWNLLPSLRSVNQNQKSDRLPSAGRLTKAREIIVDWWTAGYTNNANALIGERFRTEATASLPGIVEAPSPETIFDEWRSNDCGFIRTSRLPNGNSRASTSPDRNPLLRSQKRRPGNGLFSRQD